MSSEHEQPFVERARETLRASEHRLDELTLARLRASRLRAVAACRSRRAMIALCGGALGAAAALALAVGVWLLPGEPPPLPSLEDLPLLSSGEDLELLDELDFYLWLEYGPQETG